MLALNYLWPTLYSIPGVRLKERGVLGVLSDAAGSHITPTLFAFADASVFVPGTVNGVVLAAVLLWATALGIKGILYHMIADRANDETAGVATFATTRDVGRLFAVLVRYNLLLEFPVSMFLTVVVAAFLPLAVVALALYVALEGTKYVLGFEFAVEQRCPLTPRKRSVRQRDVLHALASARRRRPACVPRRRSRGCLFFTLWSSESRLPFKSATRAQSARQLRTRLIHLRSRASRG